MGRHVGPRRDALELMARQRATWTFCPRVNFSKHGRDFILAQEDGLYFDWLDAVREPRTR